MKYLFIDESIDQNYYVVGGILTNSENDLLLVYNQFKKQVLNMPLTNKQKINITTEYKSTLLDKTYPQIKKKFLYKLNSLNCNVIYSHKKLEEKLNKNINENTYIELLTNIINAIDDDVIVVTFDNFSNAKFENRIIETIGSLANVKSIKKDYSYNNKGLQFADNVVGVIRRKLSNTDSNGFFDIISKRTIEI
ncbi:MAG: DUF3800 domain-containing protein [Erysipelotrichaceae bacterium]|nr:DUF3800 domain-containing protein [Erysipelotrichaceae bacterium]